ncbi:hypothetical protein [Sphingomonas koreensis]
MTLLAEIEAFLTDSEMSASRFGKLSVNDPQMVPRLRAGREATPSVAARVRGFIAAERDNPSPKVKRGPQTEERTCLDCPKRVFRQSLRCRPCSAIVRRGIARNRADRLMPLPDDFAEVAATRTTKEIGKHYGVGERTTKRWLALAGIVRDRGSRLSKLVPGAVPEPVAAPRKAASRAFWRKPGPRPLPDARDCSRAGKAAQFLQKYGPVTRCDADGRLDPKGTHWLRGGRFVLSDAEIMDRATRQGWRPDAWREVIAA